MNEMFIMSSDLKCFFKGTWEGLWNTPLGGGELSFMCCRWNIYRSAHSKKPLLNCEILGCTPAYDFHSCPHYSG